MGIDFSNGDKEALKNSYDLIARILNAKMENEGLEEYQCILNNEFLAFSNEVEFKEQAVALHALQELGNELQLVASYPSLFQKSMVAVGGGFSAGKSSFLNYLLGLNLKLSANSTPTTAIPTYCLKGEREVLMGCSQNGGMVELPHLTFDHKFLDSLGFNLKEVMPSMLLSAPSVPFEFLCFIDTPGYDAPNQGYTGGDRQDSKEYLANAKYILWVIDCQHGTIQSDDLDYLQELYEEHGKQVFIVLNRTDLKITIQLEEIAVQTKETLENSGIEFLGIGAYSSERYQEIKEFSEKSPVFDSLEKFLTELNKKGEKQNEILKVLYEVHLAYEKAIQQDADKFKRYQDALHSIKLDLMQKGFDDFSDASFNKIESLKKEFSEQERSKRENLAQLNQVINLFKKSIDKVFDRVSAFTWEKYKEENDDEENDEENYREFEEIKKMVLYFRDCWMFVVEQLDGKSSQTELQKYKGFVSRNNKLLQLEFSMKNLLTLRQFKDTYREWYSKLRQLNEVKEVVSELRDYWLQELPPSAKDWISYCSTLLKLDYSLENLQKLRRFKDNFKKDYQKCKRSR
ncbi:dynamin-like GTPase family protein [Helicobacter pylori]|uniref:dynamin family protein n=1 Tax=Helicobacter pylori TaxID=210 RepID=UPI001FD5729C|nr:dynamin-like GTPase family protein [Helicobacter pylori]UOR79844.1 dynamin-like GTPase family protein [Helicobacter pylori]